MFEDLGKVPWSKLGHAYGSAEDVPACIRDLTSTDSEVRKHAMYELCGNIWHQGTVYEATAYAVPFLIEILTAETQAQIDEVLILLSQLANGTSYHDVHQHLEMHRKEAETGEWEQKIERELVWVRKASEAVKAGKQIYLRLLSDKSAAVRDAAAYLLASLHSTDAETASQIWRAYEADDDERAKASFLLAFAKLSEPDDLTRSSLLHVLCTQQTSSLRLAATLALTRLFPSQVPQEAVEAMLEGLYQTDICPALAESPWAQVDEMEMRIINHLSLLEGNAALLAEEALVMALATQEHPHALTTAEALLTMAFKKSLPANATFDSLTEQQQRVLRTIAENRNVWVQSIAGEPAPSMKASLLIRTRGLPNYLRDLLKFITDECHTFPQSSVPTSSNRPIDRVKGIFGRRQKGSG